MNEKYISVSPVV